MQDTRTNWMAIWSLVLSIISILCCIAWWAALVIAAASVIMGIIGLRSDNPNQKDAAIAGIVVGAVGFALSLTVAVIRIMMYANLQGVSLSMLGENFPQFYNQLF